jgi:N-acetylglucosaminyl-diphospho-decaprenol L-rhamnosyltransferase
MSQTPSATVLVVIVNYRTAGLTIDCLRSLENEVSTTATCSVRVVVTDNDSGDDSVARLQAAAAEHGWDTWVTIEPLERNGGFAFGNNAAIRPALSSSRPLDYIWLLNPDTVVRPGALKTLVTFLNDHPEVGIAGSRLVDAEGTPEWSAFRFHSVWSELENGAQLGLLSKLLSRWVLSPPAPLEASPCDWASGACLLIRRQVFEAVGLLDENYFMYFEEVDFCRRARQAGWTCWYVPEAEVMHLAGQSSGVTGKQAERRRRPRYWFEARRYYFLKHLGPMWTLVADLAWCIGCLSFRIRQVLQRKSDTMPAFLLRDFVHYNFLSRRWPSAEPGAAEVSK